MTENLSIPGTNVSEKMNSFCLNDWETYSELKCIQLKTSISEKRRFENKSWK